jgi:N-acetylmuramate 1-kinase
LKREVVELTPAQNGFLSGILPWFNARSCSVACAGCAGSERVFFRVASPRVGESAVLVVWNSGDKDWERFIAIERDLAGLVPFLPRIYAYDDKHGLILEEDLGNQTLIRRCRRAKGADVLAAYRKVLDALAEWQRVDTTRCAVISGRDMDEEMFLWESDYFAEHCVGEFFGLDAMLSAAWERERMEMAAEAAGFSKVCIHRDFQSENILLRRGAVRMVDYQGARRGPAGYDLASLLYDPYVARLTPAVSARLFEYFTSIAPVKVTARSFRICAVQRLMQALGAYANLSIHKGKERYRDFVPVALQRLKRIAAPKPSFPALLNIVDACLEACGKTGTRRC